MRKAVAVFLLVVFLFNLTGLFIVFKIQKSFIRNEVMQLLLSPDFEKDLTVITVTVENKKLFEWENEKEFRYNGIMYDIVKEKTNAVGELEFVCFADEDDTKLWSSMTELVKNNNSSQTIKNLVKLFSSIFLPAAKISVDYFSDTSLMHHSFSATIPFAENEIPSPPPKLV